MKFDFSPKALIIDDIAETQDGGLVHNRKALTKYSKTDHDDPVGMVIGNAIARLDEDGDLSDVQRELEYSLHEINKALDVVKKARTKAA